MDIDLLSPARFAAGQPHDQFRWLRDHDPVHWHAEPDGPGFWAVTRFDEVWAVDRDFQAFSSEPTIMIADPLGDLTFGGDKMMLMMDPPAHTAFRKLVRAEFTAPPPACGPSASRSSPARSSMASSRRANAISWARWPGKCPRS